MIKFILLVNKLGQVRAAQYYEKVAQEDKEALEGEVIRRCLTRGDNQCSFVEYRNFKLVYRRYATLFFIVGVDEEENELAILEFVHLFVETLDKYLDRACEEDIMYNLEKVYLILDEMVVNGRIIETNQNKILAPIRLMDQVNKR